MLYVLFFFLIVFNAVRELSTALRISLILFRGLGGPLSPIPNSVPLLYALGDRIRTIEYFQSFSNHQTPSDEAVDFVMNTFRSSMLDTFDSQKSQYIDEDGCSWTHKTLRII